MTTSPDMTRLTPAFALVPSRQSRAVPSNRFGDDETSAGAPSEQTHPQTPSSNAHQQDNVLRNPDLLEPTPKSLVQWLTENPPLGSVFRLALNVYEGAKEVLTACYPGQETPTPTHTPNRPQAPLPMEIGDRVELTVGEVKADIPPTYVGGD